jgi:hypothetical protein
MVEAPGREIDEGMICLAGTLTTGVQADGHDAKPDTLCDMVTAAVLSADRAGTDDAALLIARTRATLPQDLAVWNLPDEPIPRPRPASLSGTNSKHGTWANGDDHRADRQRAGRPTSYATPAAPSGCA